MHKKINLNELIRFSSEEVVADGLHESVNFRSTIINMSAGMKIKGHAAPEAIFYIIKGEGSIIVGEEEIPAKAGDFVVTPSAIPHAVQADTDFSFFIVVGNQ